MSKLFKKKNPVKTIMALWLVFLMLVTPFFEHAGLKNDTKANTLNIYSQPKITLGNFAYNEASQLKDTNDGGVTYVNVNSSYSTTTRYYYGITEINNLVEGTVNVSVGLSESFPYYVPESGHEIKVLVAKTEAEITNNVTIMDGTDIANKLQNVSDAVLNDSYGWYIGIYVRLKGVTDIYDNSVESQYALQSVYAYEKMDPFSSYTASIVKADSDDVVDSNTWHKAVRVKTDVGTLANNEGQYINSIDTYISNYSTGTNGGLIAYGYAAAGETEITWGAEGVSTVAPQGVLGSYDIYAGFFTCTEDLESGICVTSAKLGSANIDSIHPVVNESGLYYSETGDEFLTDGIPTDGKKTPSSTDSSITIRDNEKSSYRYYLEIANNDGAKVSGVKFYVNDKEVLGNMTLKDDVYVAYLRLDEVSDIGIVNSNIWNTSGTNTVKAVVTDENGLETPVDLTSVGFAEENRFNCTVSVKDKDNQDVTLGSGDNFVNKKLKFVLTDIESYNPIYKVSLMYKVDSDVYETYDSVNVTPGTPNPYYTYDSVELNIPKDTVDENGKFDDLYLYFYDENGNEILSYRKELSYNILYDKTVPELHTADDNDYEEPFALVNGWNTTASDITFDLTSGKDDGVNESDLALAYYSVDDVTRYISVFDGDKKVEVTIPASEITESTSATGTPIKIYAKDEAGNELDTTIYYKLDSSAPGFAATDSLYLSNDMGNTKMYDDSYIDDSYSVYANVTDTTAISSVKFELHDSQGVRKGEKVISDEVKDLQDYNANTSKVDPLTVTASISDLLNDIPDGNYYIKVIVTDYVNNVDKTISFVVDSKEPEYTTTLQIKNNDTGVWDDYADLVATEDGKEIVYLDSENEYRYKVEVTDEVSGVGDLTVTSTGICSIDDTATEDNGNTKVFYLNIDADSLNYNIPIDVMFDVSDNAGNSATNCKAKYALKLVKKRIGIDADLYTVDGDQKVDLSDADIKAELAAGTNVKYYILVEASDNSPISPDDITINNANISEDLSYTNAANNVLQANQRYSYFKKFILATDTNYLFEDMAVTYMDEKCPMSVLLGTILYDDTDPVFYQGGTTNEYSIGGDAWVTGISTTIDVISGTATTESKLEEAVYQIGEGNSVQSLSFNQEQTLASGTIAVTDSSATTDGTKITVYAKDEAGNETRKEYVVKVDNENPTIDSVKVGDYVNSDINDQIISGLQDVKITINDNLTLGTVNITARNIGTNDVYKVISLGYDDTDIDGLLNGTPKEINTKFTQNDGKYLPDGKYEIEITASDMAGNPAESKTFNVSIDNTQPQIDTITFQRSKDGSEWEDVPEDDRDDSTWEEVPKDEYYVDSNGNVVYVMNNDGNGQDDIYNYRFEVIASDSGSGINESTVATSENYEVYKGSDENDGIFYLNIKESSISSATTTVIDVSVSDNANILSPTITAVPRLTIASSGVTITPTVFDAEGNEVDITDENVKAKLDAGINEGYSVNINVDSPSEVTDAFLYYKNDESNKITGTVIKKEFDQITKIYTYVVKIELPTDENFKFTDLNVAVKCENGNPDSVSLTTILYDKTSPVIKDSEGNDLNIDNEKWFKVDETTTALEIPFVIKSGESGVESNLANVDLAINGVPQNVTINGSEAKGTITIQTSSVSLDGTTVSFKIKDAAGNSYETEYKVKVDAKAPVISTFTVGGNTSYSVPISGNPVIAALVSDDISFETAEITVQTPTGTESKTKSLLDNGSVEKLGIEINKSYTLSDIIGEEAKDGAYTVTLYLKDKAGHEVTKSISFTLDNTAPVVTADISSGTVSTKSDYYYSSNVSVYLTCTEINSCDITVTDNGETMTVTWSQPDANGKRTATVTLSDVGAHTIKITAKDAAGKESTPDAEAFMIDGDVPTISAILNGAIVYTESMGTVDFTSNVKLGVAVSDANEDKKDLNYQIIQTKPDKATTTSQYIQTDVREFTYSDEADYTINLYSVDMADRQSAVKTVKFRIDKNAPALSVSGISNGGAAGSATVTFTMQEAFWKDAKGTITIYKKAGDGYEETLFKTIDVTPTSYTTAISETFSDTGVYRIEFNASDRAGHTAQTSHQFTIDNKAPVITLTGASNYDITDKNVTISSTITDDFYLSKKVTVTGTRTDLDGKVHDITFSYSVTANPTEIVKELTEDGIYDITISATDIAGNSDSKSLHFTIDKSAPVIGDLSKYDGTILTEFNWDEDLDDLVSDLTVCDVHMYLNGREYDGVSEIEDGAYTLLITAEDEMGNVVEASVEFVLDTKIPVFIVTGVEEDEVKNEDYEITVSLQLEEDSLDSVLLNGQVMTITDDVCSFTVTEKGDYKLQMYATDAAGNSAYYELEFKYGEESNWWIWLLIILAILLVMTLIFIIVKKKKEEEK